jgi:hypothetical protein
MGRTSCCSEVTPKVAAMKGMAMDGRADPIVEFTTRKAVITTTKFFFRCT